MAGPGIGVTLSGPVFRAGAALVVRQMGRKTVGDLVAFAEREVKLALRPGHGLVTGNYRRNINGEILANGNGLVHDNKVVYGPWLESGRSRRGTRFKGYHMFRNAQQKVNRRKGGILKKRVGQGVRKLNGGFGGLL